MFLIARKKNKNHDKIPHSPLIMELPRQLCAMIASFVGEQDNEECYGGEFFRQEAKEYTFKTSVIDKSGVKIIYKNGLKHSFNDQPAVIHDERKEWWRNGKRHRDRAPAFVERECKAWFQNGRRHRDGAPAIVWSNGDQWWYQNGVCHRDGDAPAVINGGREEWWRNGKRHRDGGAPAVVDRFRRWDNIFVIRQEWWREGVCLGEIEN